MAKLTRRSVLKFAAASLVGVPQLSAQKVEVQPLCTFIRAIGNHLFLVNAYSSDVQVGVNRKQGTISVTANGKTRVFSVAAPNFTIQHGPAGLLYDVSVVDRHSDVGELCDCVHIDLESLS